MDSADTRRGNKVLSDILDWSGSLPGWQQDALRRIVETGDVEATDVDELTALCRVANGLLEDSAPDLRPLSVEHTPAGESAGSTVALLSVSRNKNVNALDESQELTFAPKGLTVVFGYNGSGKSGYGRVLRRACRARSKGERILPNVRKSGSGAPASAEFCYSLDDAEQPPEKWIDDQRQVDALGSVSFFDAECATVHVRERNDIAFTPIGLDLLPKLGKACKLVQKKLDAEKKALEDIRPRFLQSAQASGETAVAKLLKSLRHDTDVESVELLASLNDDQLQRLKDLPGQLANDPQLTAKELRTRAGRISSLRTTLAAAAEALSPDSIQNLKDLAADAQSKASAAEAAAKLSFSGDPLPEIGEATWRRLWEAARKYSSIAYTDREFPVVNAEDAVCVLCQQPLGNEARDRLRRFEEFVSDDTATQAQAARSRLDEAVENAERLGLQDAAVREQLKDVEFVSMATLKQVRTMLASLLWRLRLIRNAYDGGDWDFTLPPEIADVSKGLQVVVESLTNQAAENELSANSDAREKLETELSGLKAQEWLATVLGDVKEHMTRLAQIERLKECIAETRTTRITAKSKELAKENVTDQLRDAFASEIRKMQQGVRRLNVELATAAGEFGSYFYRVQLVGAHDADIGAVVSEGEHQCIALAGFLSELATEQSQSSIVFDDPVTSLDHHWRECFARRLIEEASIRQVIVFTHDIVFLHDLMTGAERSSVALALKRVQGNQTHCGIVSDGLPWVAQRALQSIDELEKQTRASRPDYEGHRDDEYERAIRGVYSRLRDTVERAVEEYIFRGVILRHRDYVNFSNLKMVTAVTVNHIERLQNLFQRCCDITSAHSRALLRSFGVPTPEDALNDLDELRSIIKDVKSCQKHIA